MEPTSQQSYQSKLCDSANVHSEKKKIKNKKCERNIINLEMDSIVILTSAKLRWIILELTNNDIFKYFFQL